MKEGSEPSLPGGGTYFLGRYRIVDEIGVGGMASVHLARADGPGGFQKWVAIKRIHRHLAEDETFIRMFLDEARIAARISHPNVAQVFDLGKHKDTYWIAMEYLHGEPLREVVRAVEEGGAPLMTPQLATKIIADSAEGLHAAHELRDKNGKLLNLVHRDVTPHNLFLTYDGAVKVVDFGIAKVTGRLSNTRAGTLKGKLAYMSPEQVRGAQVDRRTDIFALGVVLWELTTGRRLFRMESDLETLERVQACVVPPPSTVVENYPVELEAIVMRALAKDLNRRFATARELSRALQQYLMKSGSFMGSDEIGSYVKHVLSERFEKREAHLQWAAEVTQTISLEQLDGGPRELEEVSILTYALGRAGGAEAHRAAPRRRWGIGSAARCRSAEERDAAAAVAVAERAAPRSTAASRRRQRAAPTGRRPGAAQLRSQIRPAGRTPACSSRSKRMTNWPGLRLRVRWSRVVVPRGASRPRWGWGRKPRSRGRDRRFRAMRSLRANPALQLPCTTTVKKTTTRSPASWQVQWMSPTPGPSARCMPLRRACNPRPNLVRTSWSHPRRCRTTCPSTRRRLRTSACNRGCSPACRCSPGCIRCSPACSPCRPAWATGRSSRPSSRSNSRPAAS